MTCKLSQIISPAFYEAHRKIKDGSITELVLPGGRGSTKSSFNSVELILQLLKHPDCHAAVFRKVGRTLRTSVYAQICWAIGALGLYSKFRCTVSPMECTYLPTGQKIFFFGLDDADKMKSIKTTFGYIGIGWFEELDQFAGPEEIRKVEQSLFRGGSFSLSLKS
ncbi:phage terminase, large subunit, PBSX family, partial [gut metagenome]